jgi:hypothetical protein
MKISRIIRYLVIVSIIGGLVPLSLAFAAPSRSQVIGPNSIIPASGYTGPLLTLSEPQQSGCLVDDPSTYVQFETPGSIYSGYSVFRLPSDIHPRTISSLLLQINFKGAADSTQVWSWSVMDQSTGMWHKFGDTIGTNEGCWNTLVFQIRSFSRYISPSGEIRVKLTSNNASGDARLDYEALHVTYMPLPATANHSAPTIAPTKPPPPTFPITLTPTLCPPGIFIDNPIPAYGSNENLNGHIICVRPQDYKVAVYIKVNGGWWTKPTFDNSLTPIRDDGTWTTDITTGGSDHNATDIVACLLPNGDNPPIMGGGSTLPPELNKYVCTSVTRHATRIIPFAGRTWQVKFAPSPAGPGPNYFSDDPNDVWVDGNGYLHLKIVNRNGIWYSTEVICADTLQYGTYTITLGSQVDLLDKNVVLGFFTWDTDAPQYNYREIDIEFSRWGEAAAQNAQYVIQPWDIPGNRHRFYLNLPTTDSTHSIDWRPDQIQFNSRDGNGALLHSWSYTNTAYIPPPGAGNARINLWLLNGAAPSDGQDVEVIIKSFEFTPANP